MNLIIRLSVFPNCVNRLADVAGYPVFNSDPRTIGTETGRSFDGQRVLLGGKSEVPGEEKNGRVRGDRKAETR
jgi:hypothetical protein